MVINEITSRKNSIINETALLTSDKRARDTSGLFAVEGAKLLSEAVDSGFEVASVFFTKKAFSKYEELICKANCKNNYLVTDEVYSKLSAEDAPQGILTCIKKPEPLSLKSANAPYVILEDIQNPLNIGAILRVAYSFGFENIIFSDKCADIYSPKCARAAMGSLFRIKPFFSDNIPETVKWLCENKVRVFCTYLDKQSKKLGSFDFLPTDSFVIGNEGHGASEDAKNACSDTLYIPMNESAESLNAATAAAVVMWEMRKKAF